MTSELRCYYACVLAVDASRCELRKMNSSEPPGESDELRLMTLMVAYQNGDLSAFEQLYASLAQPLRRYFRNAERNAATADDLLQETFLELHRSRRTYAPPLPVRPWAFGVARNVLLRRRRASAMSGQTRELDDESDLQPVAQIGGVPLLNDVIDMEQALAELPATTREPWMLHHLFGFSFDFIATRLGITVMAAKLRSSRATKALRCALSGKLEEAR